MKQCNHCLEYKEEEEFKRSISMSTFQPILVSSAVRLILLF